MNLTINLDQRFAKRAVAVLLVAGLTIGVVAGCTEPSGSKTQMKGQDETEQAFAQQSDAVKYPKDELRDSLERRNLREKLLRYNRPDKISYLYLLSQTGGIYAYFTIKGKVSSNQSQMTTDQFDIDHGSYGQAVVNAPGDDGSYGQNEAGQFAFTTDGVMITWDTPYILTDAPLKVNAQNLVVSYVDGSRPSSVGSK